MDNYQNQFDQTQPQPEMQPQPEVQPQPEMQPQPEVQPLVLTICPNCGSSISANSTFCPICGYQFAPAVPEKKGKKGLLIAVIAIVAVLIIAIIAGVVSNVSDNSSSGSSSRSDKDDKVSTSEVIEQNHKDLYDYITSNGTYYNNMYYVRKTYENSSFMMVASNDEIYWSLSFPTESTESFTTMQLTPNTEYHKLSTDFSFSGGTEFTAKASIKTSEFNSTNPQVYNCSSDSTLMSESTYKPTLESLYVVMFNFAELALKDADITLSDLGFTSY